MAPESLIILRHPTEVSLKAMTLGTRVARELQYGSMAITWLTAGTAPA
jgi:hypothetical protein